MESIGSITQLVTSDVAQQANEANKKQLEKQPTEKSSDVFLETLNSQGDRGALIINRATPLFALLIARLNGTGDNASYYSAGDAMNYSSNTEVEVPSNTTTELTTNTNSNTSPENTGNSSADGLAAMTDTDEDNNATVTTNASSNTSSENTGNSSASVRSTPIFGNVTVPNLGFAGNGGNTNQTNVPANTTNNTTPNASSTATPPSVNSSNVRSIPIFSNVTVPSLGTVGGASQGTGGANSTAIGSPLVSSSPVATQVGTGFQSLLAGNTSADNNSSSSSHWRRGSSSSNGGFNVNYPPLKERA